MTFDSKEELQEQLEASLRDIWAENRPLKNAKLFSKGEFQFQISNLENFPLLTAWDPESLGQVGMVLFRELHHPYTDPTNERIFPVLNLSKVEVREAYRRQGLATEMIRFIASWFPDALFKGADIELSDAAVAWYQHGLEQSLPSRMLSIESDWEDRVNPGTPLAPEELGAHREVARWPIS